jgi:hypothetical protein
MRVALDGRSSEAKLKVVASRAGEEDERLPASRHGDLPVVVGQHRGGKGSTGGGRHDRPQILE